MSLAIIPPVRYAQKRAELITALCTKKRDEMVTWGPYTISITKPTEALKGFGA